MKFLISIIGCFRLDKIRNESDYEEKESKIPKNDKDPCESKKKVIS